MTEVDAIGISYGGFVTMQMKRDSEANEIGRIIIIDSPGGHFNRGEEEAMLARFGVNQPEDIFIPEDWRAVRRLMGLVFYRPLMLPPWVYRDIKKQVFSANQDSHLLLLTELRSREEEFFETDWSSVDALVIWGEEDEVFPPALGQALAKSLDAEMVVFERAAHGPNIEHPKRFNQTVLSWLKEGSETR